MEGLEVYYLCDKITVTVPDLLMAELLCYFLSYISYWTS